MKRSGMFRERNEWPSTAGGLPAEERSGYMELCDVRLAAFLKSENFSDLLQILTRRTEVLLNLLQLLDGLPTVVALSA